MNRRSRSSSRPMLFVPTVYTLFLLALLPSPTLGQSCASAITTWTGFEVDCTSTNGACSAVVDFETALTSAGVSGSYGCTDYCTAIGMSCVNAWEDGSSDSCSTATVMGCSGDFNTLSTSDGICQCEEGTTAVAAVSIFAIYGSLCDY
jgi:hypothetical protein